MRLSVRIRLSRRYCKWRRFHPTKEKSGYRSPSENILLAWSFSPKTPCRAATARSKEPHHVACPRFPVSAPASNRAAMSSVSDNTRSGGLAARQPRNGRRQSRPGPARSDLSQSTPWHPHARSPVVIDAAGGQPLRLAAVFLALRALTDAGVQHAAASAATRLQSSGWPLQQSSTRKAMTERMPSTSDR